MIVAVNGTLMRGLGLNYMMAKAGAEFIKEAKTAPCYKMYSINDQYPGMVRVVEDGASISVELWQVSKEGLIDILMNEPAGLVLGKVMLDDNSVVLGILAESYMLLGCKEITNWGGWRSYNTSV